MKNLFIILFALSTAKLIAQVDPCYNPGFELGLSGYAAYSSIFKGSSGNTSCNSVQGYSQNAGAPNSSMFLTSSGFDPFVSPDGLISMALYGTTSVRINDPEVGFNIDKLVKTITLPTFTGVYNLTYSYALVFENPTGHTNIQPFFQVNTCIQGGACNQVLCIDADMANLSPPANQGLDIKQTDNVPIVFKNWTCATIPFDESYSGKTVDVEFIASDCGAGAHFGYAYVDGLCENCGPSGTATIDPIPNPCNNNFPILVTGSLVPPPGGIVQSIELRITGEGGYLKTISTPTSLTSTNFSFTINATDLTIVGCFDVRVAIVYSVAGVPQPLIMSSSANPNTTSSVYNDFCNSIAECNCTDPALTFGRGEMPLCVSNQNTISIFGNYTLPKVTGTGLSGTVNSITINIYKDNGTNCPPGNQVPFISVPAIINTITKSFSYNIPTSSLESGCYHVLVMGNFTCSGDIMLKEELNCDFFCYNSDDCISGTVHLDPFDGNCVNLREGEIEICGSFTLPMLNDIPGELTSLILQIYTPYMQFPITDIDYNNHTFCIKLGPGNFPDGLPEGCKNITAFATFKILEDNITNASFSYPGNSDICFTNERCCKYDISGFPYCGNSCEGYYEYVHITVNNIGQDCGPGKVTYTFLTPGDFFNPITGATSTSITKDLLYYGTIYSGSLNENWYHSNLHKPIHDLNGDAPNCFLVEVFNATNQIVATKTLCFDTICPRPLDLQTRTLGNKICYPNLDPGPTRAKLRIIRTGKDHNLSIYFSPVRDEEGICYFNKVTVYDKNCCVEGRTGKSLTEFCNEVNSNPFNLDLNRVEGNCYKIQLFKQTPDGDILLHEDGCYDKISEGLIANPDNYSWSTKEEQLISETARNTKQFRLYNMVGILLYKGNTFNEKDFQIMNFPAGLYFLEIVDNAIQKRSSSILLKK